MLPDYIIYDELKKQRDEDLERERPQLEIPRHIPYWPEQEEEDEEDEKDENRGVVIIQM